MNEYDDMSITEHILRKVYNYREGENFRRPNILKFPVKKNLSFPKISDDFFLVIYKQIFD